MRLLSEAKVARRWASCGLAARRKRGGAGVRVCCAAFVGELDAGLAAVMMSASQRIGCEKPCRAYLCRLFH